MVTIAASAEQTREQRVRQAFFIVETNRAQLAKLARLIDGGEVRPKVGGVFPLPQAREAYEYKPRNGKVALSVA
jgi:NADPH:quinone reductase-like Zn-dependent oxidoreductase